MSYADDLGAGVRPPQSLLAGAEPPRSPRCPKCRRPHEPTLRCWSGRYAARVTAHILATQGRRCHMCGGRATSADHIIPRSRGGTDVDSNLRPACLPHNSGRGNRLNPYADADPAGTLPADAVSPRWRS